MTPSAVIVVGEEISNPEARGEFDKLVAAVRLRTPGIPVQAAFLQNTEPSLSNAMQALCEQGANTIAIIPCFLFRDERLQKEISELVNSMQKQFPNTEFTIAKHLGPESRIADVLASRIDEVMSLPRVSAAEIERASMRIMEELLGNHNWNDVENSVVQQLVHTSGDPTLVTSIHMSAGAAEAGRTALLQGAPIVVDVKMVAAGISHSTASPFKNEVLCAIDNDSVIEIAKRQNRTRAECAMELLVSNLNGAVVAVGDAPTALRFILALANAGKAKPALVIGMPVGFEDAAESKEALMASKIPFIVIAGPRGGSPLAAATINALASSL